MGPVRRYAAPGYPTRLELQAHPTLLQTHLPAGWLVEGMAGTVSFLLAAGTAGCGREPVTIVAPLFEHGEGRSYEGCMVLTPPAYLSGEAALQVINEEMATAPVALSQRDVEWPEVKLHQRQWNSCDYPYQPVHIWNAPDAPTSSLRVDGLDPERQVAVKFVSLAAYAELGGPMTPGCSVQEYDFKEAATYVGDEVRDHANARVYFGVFYDPVAETTDPVTSADLLRQQVRDFVAWLQAQGAI